MNDTFFYISRHSYHHLFEIVGKIKPEKIDLWPVSISFTAKNRKGSKPIFNDDNEHIVRVYMKDIDSEIKRTIDGKIVQVTNPKKTSLHDLESFEYKEKRIIEVPDEVLIKIEKKNGRK